MPLTIPDEVLKQAGLSEREALIEIACRLFDADKISKLPACRLAGLTRVEFEGELARRGLSWIHVDWDETYEKEFADISREATGAKKTAQREIVSIVVSDTSAIAALFHIGHVDLLQSLFGKVLIPPAVMHELANPRGPRSPIDIAAVPFVTVQTPTDARKVVELKADLDDGESEAIALAIELSADWLLMDEYEGRQMAAKLGLRTTGVLGIFLRAKNAGHILMVKPLIDRLVNEIDFRVSRELRDQTLKLAGE